MFKIYYRSAAFQRSSFTEAGFTTLDFITLDFTNCLLHCKILKSDKLLSDYLSLAKHCADKN